MAALTTSRHERVFCREPAFPGAAETCEMTLETRAQYGAAARTGSVPAPWCLSATVLTGEHSKMAHVKSAEYQTIRLRTGFGLR